MSFLKEIYGRKIDKCPSPLFLRKIEQSGGLPQTRHLPSQLRARWPSSLRRRSRSLHRTSMAEGREYMGEFYVGYFLVLAANISCQNLSAFDNGSEFSRPD